MRFHLHIYQLPGCGPVGSADSHQQVSSGVLPSRGLQRLGSSRPAWPRAVFAGINPCVVLVAPWGGTATLPSFEDKAEARGLGMHQADRPSQD